MKPKYKAVYDVLEIDFPKTVNDLEELLTDVYNEGYQDGYDDGLNEAKIYKKHTGPTTGALD